MSVLREAYELIRDPERWVQGTLSLPTLKHGVPGYRFCVAGAISMHARSPEACKEAVRILDGFTQTMFGLDPIEVNDKLGHEAIIQALEKAIIETEGSL